MHQIINIFKIEEKFRASTNTGSFLEYCLHSTTEETLELISERKQINEI